MGSSGTFGAAAYGGEGWSPRLKKHAEEIGSVWAACGQDSEWRKLKSVLLYRPGSETVASRDHNTALQLAPLGIECLATPAAELSKAAGAVGCLTGVVHREMATSAV